MTIRKELAKYLNDALFIQNGKKDYDLVDDIMKLNRKRIDKLREEQLSNLNPTDEYVGILKGLRMARELFK